MVALLILSGAGALNHSTKMIWQKVCDKFRVKLEIYTLPDDPLPNYLETLELKSYPSLIISNKVMAVGHPDSQAAEKIIFNLINDQY